VCIIGQQSAQHHKEDGKRATEGVNDAAAAKKASWQCSRSTTNAISELLLFWVCVWCDEIYI
jgi:hypothetical protein